VEEKPLFMKKPSCVLLGALSLSHDDDEMK